jgi:hypothetical protein
MWLGLTFDTWQRWLAGGGVLAGVLALASLISQTKATQRAILAMNLLAALIGSASAIVGYFVSKAAGVEADVKIAQASERSALAQKDAALATERSSLAHKDAAQAKQATVAIEGENIRLRTRFEEERAARLKLEEHIRPRRLSEGDKLIVIAAISRFAGQTIRLEQQSGDREIEEYAQDFSDIFRRSKWKLVGEISTGISEIHLDVDPGGTRLFVLPADIGKASPAVIALQKSLIQIGVLTEPNLLAEHPRSELKPGAIQLRIGKKLEN